MTYFELYDPAMKIRTQAQADDYFKKLVALCLKENVSRAEAEQIVRGNLGYYAGYYEDETRERVERLFQCEHPFFGKIAVNGPPTMEEALQLGINMGRELMRKAKAK